MNICTEFWVILNKGVFRSAFWIDKPERPKIEKLTEGVEILHAHATGGNDKEKGWSEKKELGAGLVVGGRERGKRGRG